MLTHIHIKNFIIVKSLSLDFQHGLHVLTGETGAGKSIWIDAIEIALGGRADANMIYAGEKNAEITLCFDLRHLPAAKQWLQEHALPDEDECIIRRTIDQDKPSRTTINGTPTPQQFIRALAETILCIHGQHHHQRLLKSDMQRIILDRFAGNEALVFSTHQHHETWKTLDRESQQLQLQMQNKSSDLALWQYQLDELQSLTISENEYDTLFAQFQKAHHTKHFAESMHEAYALINNDDATSASDLVQQALHRLHSLPHDDASITNIRSLLQTAAIHIDEASDALQAYCHANDFSPAELAHIERRLATLQDIARKHHVDPTQLSEVETGLQHKIAQLEQADDVLASLEKQKKEVVAHYQKTAATLSKQRNSAAKKLSSAITEAMQTLGMNGGQFEIALPAHNKPIHFYGNEDIQFLIATNPGQSPQPLSQVVSGGELSRLSLIIQMLTVEKNNTPTIIFDEVDVGVGGKTATLIGRLLRELGQKTQVLCVTHLPQVAACGHHHFYAKKISDGKTTSTTILPLTETERTEELARMLSGSHITENSLSHARELLTTINE